MHRAQALARGSFYVAYVTIVFDVGETKTKISRKRTVCTANTQHRVRWGRAINWRSSLAYSICRIMQQLDQQREKRRRRDRARRLEVTAETTRPVQNPTTPEGLKRTNAEVSGLLNAFDAFPVQEGTKATQGRRPRSRTLVDVRCSALSQQVGRRSRNCCTPQLSVNQAPTEGNTAGIHHSPNNSRFALKPIRGCTSCCSFQLSPSKPVPARAINLAARG